MTQTVAIRTVSPGETMAQPDKLWRCGQSPKITKLLCSRGTREEGACLPPKGVEPKEGMDAKTYIT